MRIAILFTFFCNLLFSCQNNDKRHITSGTLNKKDILYTVVDSAGVPSDLFHFTPEYGTTYYYTVETEAHVKQEVMNKAMETNSTNKIAFHYISVKNGNGGTQLQLTYDDFKLKGNSGKQEINVDASNTDEDSPEQMFKALKDAVFTISISPSGAITNISGIKALKDTMAKLGAGRPQDEQLLQATIDKTVSEETLKQLVSPNSEGFPKNALEIGESWKINGSTFQSDFKIPITTIYTLEDVEDGIATISIKANIKLENHEMQMQGYNVITSFTGSQKGNLKVDMLTGTVQNSDQEINMKGEFEVMGMKVPITIEYSNKVEKVK